MQQSRVLQNATYLSPCPFEVKQSKALDGSSTAQAASVKNQEITNKLAKQSLALPRFFILSPDLIKSVREIALQAYENLKLSTATVKTSPKFIEALDSIKPYRDAIQAAKDFPMKLEIQSFKLLILLSLNFDVNSAVSKINILRNDADKAFRAIRYLCALQKQIKTLAKCLKMLLRII